MTNATILLPWAVFLLGSVWMIHKAKKAKEDYRRQVAERDRLTKQAEQAIAKSAFVERYGTIAGR